MKQVTIKDIAREAGVSTAAVSYVVNGKKGVSPQTRKKIEKVIKENGYQPSLRSQSLSLGKNYCVHAVIRREAAPACKAFYFGVIAKMVEQEKDRFSVIPVFQGDDTDKDKTLLKIIQSDSTDGVITFQDIMPQVQSELEAHDIPFIIINPGIRATNSTSIILDFEKLAYQATSFLTKHGHRDIAMIGMECMPLFFEKTRSGFLQALKDAGIKPNLDWIHGGAASESSAALAMEDILEAGAPSAVFCVQDNFAISAMSACAKAGLRVPEDISFIAIDDVPGAQYLNPPLTTIPVSPTEIAQAALLLISEKMKNGSPESIELPSHEISVRNSVCAIQPIRL